MAKWRDIKNSKNRNTLKQNSTSNTIYTPIPPKLKAFLTDSFLITTPILYIVIYLIMGSGTEFQDNMSTGWTIIFSIHLPIIILFWITRGQTPGLKAYSLKLVDFKEKRRVYIPQALLRYFATIFAFITIFLLFVPFFRKDKRSFQDIVSSSIVIDEKDSIF